MNYEIQEITKDDHGNDYAWAIVQNSPGEDTNYEIKADVDHLIINVEVTGNNYDEPVMCDTDIDFKLSNLRLNYEGELVRKLVPEEVLKFNQEFEYWVRQQDEKVREFVEEG